MDYAIGSTGRVFAVRFDHEDDFLGGLTELALKENIRCAWFNVIGGILEADVVTGPKAPVMPPEPVWHEMREAREVLGTGSLFRDETGEPKIHLHTALGHHGHTLTACMRKGTKTYLVLEVYLVEIAGIDASRPWYAAGGFNRVEFGG